MVLKATVRARAAQSRAQQAEPLSEAGWRAVDASGDLAETLQRARVASDLGAGV
jgi:hypothetical protein